MTTTRPAPPSPAVLESADVTIAPRATVREGYLATLTGEDTVARWTPLIRAAFAAAGGTAIQRELTRYLPAELLDAPAAPPASVAVVCDRTLSVAAALTQASTVLAQLPAALDYDGIRVHFGALGDILALDVAPAPAASTRRADPAVLPLTTTALIPAARVRSAINDALREAVSRLS